MHAVGLGFVVRLEQVVSLVQQLGQVALDFSLRCLVGGLAPSVAGPRLRQQCPSPGLYLPPVVSGAAPPLSGSESSWEIARRRRPRAGSRLGSLV